MSLGDQSRIPEILKKYETDLLQDWLSEQLSTGSRKNLSKETELREECREFLELLRKAVQGSNLTNIQ
ncbi:MAG TPA: RsbRD N-terminal domain-containing protein, partial [Chroococcales cyanobacterium]